MGNVTIGIDPGVTGAVAILGCNGPVVWDMPTVTVSKHQRCDAATLALELGQYVGEATAFVERIARGIEVTPETLAVDVIDGVGPGGHYLGESHTLKHFKTEFWFPRLIDRERWEDWENAGKIAGEKLEKAQIQLELL